MHNIFQTRKTNCNLRSQTDFVSNCVNVNKFGRNGAWFHWKLKILEVSKYSQQIFEIGSLKTVTVTYVRPI